MQILNLFPTPIYRSVDNELLLLNTIFKKEIYELRDFDFKKVTNIDLLNLYKWEGYTSYFTNRTLFQKLWFEPLARRFKFHVENYIKLCNIDISSQKLELTECFANIMSEPFHNHGRHIHTSSAFSGVYYVLTDNSSGKITFEDPALDHWMYKFNYSPETLENVTEVSISPNVGEILIFPGHLPHKVDQSYKKSLRIAISFNYTLVNKI